MNNSASTSRPEGPSSPAVVVYRSNRLSRDPLRRALLEALTTTGREVPEEASDATQE